jgi:predicted AlkP superfamily pyrophosphatase or phosphodiesterase
MYVYCTPSFLIRINPMTAIPDYHGGCIVNLMSSIITSFGEEAPIYPGLRDFDQDSLINARNVVLLIVDGLGYNFLNRYGHESVFYQNLAERITSVFPSTTATAITTFFTGAAPQQHGITGWFTYFKELGDVLAVLPFRSRHGGPSLGESGIDASTLLDSGSAYNLMRNIPTHTVVPKRIANSDFNLAFLGRAAMRPYTSMQHCFNNIREIIMMNSRRKFIRAYWPELDSLAHTHGINSQQVVHHFHQLDYAFKHFLDSITGTQTIVIVTADHGQVDSPPECQIQLTDHPDLGDTLILPLCGDPRLAYCYIQPSKEALFESYVQNNLKGQVNFYRSEQLLENGYFGLGKANPALINRIGHYTLIMKENYTLKDWVVGEQRHTNIGTHGGISEDEMYVPLILAEIR